MKIREAHPQARWKADHDPDARPLGCNGKYGGSGYQVHYRKGEPACDACRISHNHSYAERERGGNPTPRKLKPCGTSAAARRHRKRGEEVCFPCRLAESAESRAKYIPRSQGGKK